MVRPIDAPGLGFRRFGGSLLGIGLSTTLAHMLLRVYDGVLRNAHRAETAP